MALNTDIPTRADLERLLSARNSACVSIYVPTSPITQETERARIELKNLNSEAIHQLEDAGHDKREVAAIRESLEDLDDDEVFWVHQSHSLAVFASVHGLRTFRLPNRLTALVEVSDRFHVKPLLRAVTFPQAAFVLALSENSVRLLEISPDLPPREVDVPGLPSDAASSVGKASIRDRSPRRRLQGSEGQKVRLRQFARRVDEAIRPILSGRHQPLILAATAPLDSIFTAACSYPHLAGPVIRGNPDSSTDSALAEESRPILDQIYAEELTALTDLYEQRAVQGRATDDLASIARAATMGAIDVVFVDIDATVPGTLDAETGELTLDESDDAANYGVIDEIARRVLLSSGRPLAVRHEDIPGPGPVAAILRYPV